MAAASRRFAGEPLMPLRLMQVALPNRADLKAEQLLEGHEVIGVWDDPREKTRKVIQVLVPAEEAEEIMDKLGSWYEGHDGFRVTLIPVAASIPRDDENGAKDAEAVEASAVESLRKSGRVSREELYQIINESLGVNRVFLAMVVLSSIVAAVGLWRNDVAVIIGAMVIAPLLGPNVAMALAATLGDFALMRRAFITNLVGFLIGLSIAVGIGLALSKDLDVTVAAIEGRTHLGLSDLVLALAAGAAGAFAISRGLSGALIGVMVAVALMPPLVVFGMMVGSGHWKAATGAFLLVSANVVCVNLAGVATFVAQGVTPRYWWEGEQARRATRKAVVVWVALLLLLAGLLAVSNWKW